jgi:D-alanine-D-alanine ligase
LERHRNDRWTIAVLAGGDSAEREVSLRSGAEVARALASVGHRVTTLDPAHCDLNQVVWSHFDACFVALHGGAGEDGHIQQLLEHHGVAYTGSDPTACRLAMSKLASKRRFVAGGVPTPDFAEIAAYATPAQIVSRVARLDYPLIVKPDAQGSSIGVAAVNNPAELSAAIRTARRFAVSVLAEARIVGREFTVAVIDEMPLPPIEIVTPEPVFTYEAKYSSPSTEYLFDFELPGRTREHIVDVSVAAAKALGTRGLARVDVMLDADGDAWVLEVNTVPGLTARSLAPLAAR